MRLLKDIAIHNSQKKNNPLISNLYLTILLNHLKNNHMKNLLLTAMVSLMAISAQAQIVPNELHCTDEALTVTTNFRSLAHFKAPKLGPPALMQNAVVNTTGWSAKTEDNVQDPLALTLYLKKVEEERSMQSTSVVYSQNNTSYAHTYNLNLANELKNRFPADNRFAYSANQDSAKITFQTELKPLMAGE